MPADTFDITAHLRTDLPPAAVKWSGFPKFNFVGGHNDPDSIPVKSLIAAAADVIQREGRTLATYGLESGSQGYKPLREFLAKKLKTDAAISCTTDDILVLSGSGQGLNLVGEAFVSPGDTIIIEQATYGGAMTRFRRTGAKIVGVPVDHDGLSAAALERALADLKAKGITPKFIYTIPTVQNPTATIMSLERREAILKLATQYGVPIFEDECYADLTWTGTRPPAIRAIANDDRVIHIGSFSKSIAPALRLGYLVAGWPVMSRILGIKADSGTGALEQMILAEFCRAHFDDHVKALRKALRRKLDVLMESLAQEFGTAAEFEVPPGGIFLWVKLPEAVDTLKLFQAASKEGVAINPGVEWSTDADYGRARLRLCFANPNEATIRAGVARLADICHREFGVPKRSSNVERAAH
jgi:2-aminoadipate transaminase